MFVSKDCCRRLFTRSASDATNLKKKCYFHLGVSYDLLTDDERRNLTQVALLVLDLTPKAMRRLATSNKNSWTPEAIGDQYRRSEVKINKVLNLTTYEKEMFRNPGDGFINCDTCALYKIIRYFDLVPIPTKGWAAKATNFKNYGDLVEKLREIRNYIVHSPHVRFSENAMYFIKYNICTIIHVMCLLDKNLKELKSHIESYLSEPYPARPFSD